jgi:tetratricopeptide (TPR) repeat protein
MGIIEMFRKQEPVKRILYIVCIAGLVLSTAISIPLLMVSIIHARENSPLKHVTASRSNPFIESLNQFDEVLSQNRSSLPLRQLDSILNSAEKYAVNADAHLSVLKRRRILAKEMPEYQFQYQNAAVRSFEKFPYSEIISIVAGDALLQKSELNVQDKAALSSYIQNISVRNPLILLGFHLMEGTAQNLSSARQIPQAEEMFTLSIDYLPKEEQQNLITSAAILRILEGNTNGAINLLHKYKTVLLQQAQAAWFMAETLYDFDEPMNTASILGIEDYPYVNSQSIIRLSDALYRANNIDDARFFWNLLTFSENEQDSAPKSMLEKALFNLASTAKNDDEKRFYIEELLRISPDNIAGIILFSRLQNHDDAISTLNTHLIDTKNVFLELERIKRMRGYAETGKTAADTWLLLGNYPQSAELYQWAAYFFETMRMFDESAQLEKNAGYHNIESSWFVLHQALNAMRKGNLDEAEQILLTIPPENGPENGSENGWEVSANLGLIKESQLSFTEAITYYETALSLCNDNKAQAAIQLRLARCLNATGNPRDAIRILNTAQELDPDNLRIRLEIRKLQEIE